MALQSALTTLRHPLMQSLSEGNLALCRHTFLLPAMYALPKRLAADKRDARVGLKDDDKVAFIDARQERSEITFRELKEKAEVQAEEKGRRLVRAIAGGQAEMLPTFQMMSDHELETAVRVARQHQTKVIYEHVNFTGEHSSHIRQKKLYLNANISDHDLDIAINRAKKWLHKGSYVHITIKTVGTADRSVDRVIGRMKETLQKEPEICDKVDSHVTFHTS